MRRSFRIGVSVKPNARKSQVTRISDTEYRVSVHAAPQEGKANRALIDLLADYFSVPKAAVRIVRGQAAKKKLVEIAEP